MVAAQNKKSIKFYATGLVTLVLINIDFLYPDRISSFVFYFLIFFTSKAYVDMKLENLK